MKYNKYNKKYGDKDPNSSRIVIASDEESVPMIDEFGEPIKRKSRLTTPRSKNTETLISTVSTPGFDSVKIDHTPTPKGGLKALQDKGLRITSYVETDGGGAPITQRRYDEDE